MNIKKTNFDARKVFPICDHSVDLIITDPPWSWDDKYPGGFSTKRKDNRLGYLTLSEEELLFALKECYRVLKEGSFFFCWVTNQHLPILFRLVEKTPFKYKQIITWVKNTMGLGYTFRNKTEHCILFITYPYKRKIKVNNLPNVFFAKNPRYTQKPIELSKIFIEQGSNTGDLVFDPFAGSGNIIHTGLDRNFWINDIKYIIDEELKK